QPRIVTADTQLGTRQVPAALNLAFGTLFFGYDLSNTLPPPGSAADVARRERLAEDERRDKVPFAAVHGAGTTLSGRAPRPRPPADPPATTGGSLTTSSTTTAAAEPGPTAAVPFTGQGNTLGGGGGGGGGRAAGAKKQVEVIEIDDD
ncbi:hypothetical protein JCM3766R1_003055, partial [Sporobolomyces carnicolor]